MMKYKDGVWLPDHDKHFIKMLEKSAKKGELGTYQAHVYRMGLKSVIRYQNAVDVGAHVGFFSRMMAEDFANVTAFEPSPENIECFLKNCNFPNVTLYQYALGSQPRQEKLIVIPNNSGANWIEVKGCEDKSVIMKPSYGAAFIEVKCMDYFNLEMDLLKIDVQGFEVDVLIGGKETILRCKPAIIIEEAGWGPGMSKIKGEPAVDLLKHWGFIEASRVSKDVCMVWPDHPQPRTFRHVER